MSSSNSRNKINYTEVAAEQLRQDIVDGKLRPTQRLVEAEVAKKLGMSRTPVRDALKHLEMQGYLSRLPGGGLIVTNHSPSQIRNLYETREALETMAIKLACQRANKEQLGRAAEYHARSLEAAHNRDVDKFTEWNSAFHDELLAGCGNEQLWSLIHTFRDQVFDRRILRVFTAAEWRAMNNQHQRMLDAVRQGNIRMAEKAIHEHARTAMRAAVEQL